LWHLILHNVTREHKHLIVPRFRCSAKWRGMVVSAVQKDQSTFFLEKRDIRMGHVIICDSDVLVKLLSGLCCVVLCHRKFPDDLGQVYPTCRPVRILVVSGIFVHGGRASARRRSWCGIRHFEFNELLYLSRPSTLGSKVCFVCFNSQVEVNKKEWLVQSANLLWVFFVPR
jgi:hypothetical protein